MLRNRPLSCLLLVCFWIAGPSRLVGQAPVEVPKVWKSPPGDLYAKGNGYAWFRCWVDLPPDWRDKTLSLYSEAVDDAREVYVNGAKIGSLGSFPPNYQSGLGKEESFVVPKDLLRVGESNVVAIRVYDDKGRRNFNVAAPVFFVGDQAIRLAGAWQYLAGDQPTFSASTVPTEADKQFRFSRLQPADVVRSTLKKLDDEAGPLSVAETLKRSKVFDDLAVEACLAEPGIGQPLSIKFDARGRLWLMEYLQYPTPAGLKAMSRDVYLRTVYDRMPAPPPNHFKGRDRISIHEDTDQDGRFDKHTTFVEGLSLATSCALSHDGVYVLNPPFLLFYPDRNQDDLPDGDPEVLLEGFGIEDSHSIASNLRWGPDGWLYGAQGSTVTGNIKRFGSKDAPVVSMGQLVWRYHPGAKKYEVFAEGGGNTFGVEIDAKGRIYSGHNGGDTRGFHYVQGGYYRKGFEKHGELSNPFAFGYLSEMAHGSVPRFTHTFLINEADGLPSRYAGKLFGVGPLQSHVVASEISVDRSSFKTKDIGYAFSSQDTWVRPVDIQLGPDGALYVADLYEQRIDHSSHYQGRIHRESGRIYRLRDKNKRWSAPKNLQALASVELIDQLRSPNRWHRQTVQRVLTDRKDPATRPILEAILERQEVGQMSLEAAWALYSLDGMPVALAQRLLRHPDPYVRLWTVRLVADEPTLAPELAPALVELAQRETYVEVRSQLACSARRLSAEQAMPLIRSLVAHREDNADVHIPLLLWWAIESKAASAPAAVAGLFSDPLFWREPITQTHLVSRVMRRYAQAGTNADLLQCAALLRLAPRAEDRKLLLAGFESAFAGQSLARLPKALLDELAKAGGGSLALRIRQNDPAAINEAVSAIANPKGDVSKRIALLETLGQVRPSAALGPIADVVDSSAPESVREAAILALQAYSQPTVADRLIQVHAKLPKNLQELTQAVLATRKDWAVKLLDALDAGQVDPKLAPLATARKLLLLPDETIARRVEKRFGKMEGATTEQMRQRVENLVELLGAGAGNPANGKHLFGESCGKCHVLFNQGGKVGPDLTAYKRDDLRRMLINVVNPSAEIREGYENFILLTVDGRTLNGFVAEKDNKVVVLRTIEGATTVIDRNEIEAMKASPRSLMPENLLDKMTDQQVRDLFAFLRSTQPVP